MQSQHKQCIAHRLNPSLLQLGRVGGKDEYVIVVEPLEHARLLKSCK